MLCHRPTPTSTVDDGKAPPQWREEGTNFATKNQPLLKEVHVQKPYDY